MDQARKARYWVIATTLGGIVVASAAVFNSVTSGINNVASFRKQVASSSAPAQPPAGTSLNPQPPKAKSTTKTFAQVSTGDQSPDLRDVQKSVRLQYGGAQTASRSQDKVSPIRIPNTSSVQFSTGKQSPNISGVGGDVDIKFAQTAGGNSPQAPNAEN
jgi:hypothetical protein